MDESHVPMRHRTPDPSLVLLLFFNTRIMDTNRLTIFFKYYIVLLVEKAKRDKFMMDIKKS